MKAPARGRETDGVSQRSGFCGFRDSTGPQRPLSGGLGLVDEARIAGGTRLELTAGLGGREMRRVQHRPRIEWLGQAGAAPQLRASSSQGLAQT